MGDRSRGVPKPVGGTIRILAVGDGPVLEAVLGELADASERLELVSEPTVAGAVDRVERSVVDCVVSTTSGVDDTHPVEGGPAGVVAAVREVDPDIPFAFVDTEADERSVDALSERVATRVARHRRRQRAVELERFRSVVDDARRTLVDASTRTAAETAVCEALGGSEAYRWAWFGDLPRGADRIDVRVWSGTDEDTLDHLVGVAAVAARDEGPADGTGLQGEPDGDDRPGEAVDSVAAVEDARGAVATVSLEHDGVDYGHLGVCADREGAFCSEERDLLSAFGDDVARALSGYTARRERDRYETVVENTGDPAFGLDADDRFTAVNDALETLTGRDRDRLLSRHVSTVFDGDEPVSGDRSVYDVLSGGDRRHRAVEVEVQTAEALLTCEVRLGLVDGPDREEVVAGTLRNISERRAHRRELHREGDRFAALFGTYPEPAVEYKFDDGDPVVRAVNPAFEETFGYDAETAVGQVVDDFLAPVEREAAANDLTDRVRAGEPVDTTVRRRTIEGSRHFRFRTVEMPVEGSPDGVAVYADVTAQKRREGALTALHETTRELMDATEAETIAEVAVDAANAVLDLPISGLWLYDEDEDVLRPAAVTDEGQAVTGGAPTYTGDDSLSSTAFHSGDTAVYDDLRKETGVYNPETAIRSEMILPLGDHGVMNVGSTTPGAFDDIDVSLARVLAANTQAALDRAEREMTLRANRRELERKRDRLEEFAGLVSHDLRNPLETAMGYLELFEKDNESAHFERVKASLDRMDRIIDETLTLARNGRTVGKTEPVDLTLVAQRCWHTVDTDGATLDADAAPVVDADPSRVKHLLENLFRNSVEHGRTDRHDGADGRSLTITVGDTPDGFFIADDGAGIDPADRDRLFEAGYSTVPHGTGFGLAIVQRIAEAHDWTVTATENADGGARFEFDTGGEIGD